MHVPETESPSIARRKPIQITFVMGTNGAHPDVVKLFQTVYGEAPVCESWPTEAVRDRLHNVLNAQLLPLCLAAWGDKQVGGSGKLVGLLTAFQLDSVDHQRAFGKSLSREIDERFNGHAGHIGYVQDLLVSAACRNKGIGHALIAEAETFFRSQHMDSFLCRARSDEDDRFRASAQKNGFRALAAIDDNYVLLGRRMRVD